MPACGETWYELPIGLMCLATYLRHQGYSVEICDSVAGADPVTMTAKLKPRTIGFTCTTPAWPQVRQTLPLIREAAPAATIVVGGPHPSICARQVADHAEVNFVVRGEGEYALSALLKGEASVSGKVITSERVRQEDLIFPEYRSLETGIEKFSARFEKYLGKRYTTVVASRGCVFSCGFCAVGNIFGRRWVGYDTETVLQGISSLVADYGIGGIFFKDSDLFINRKWAAEILRKLPDIGVEYMANTRVTTIDDETTELLRSTGCRRIWLGVESGNDRILKSINKGIDVAAVRRAFALLRKANVETEAYFMVGFPHEDHQTIRDTIKLYREIAPDFSHWFVFQPLPGTALQKHCLEQGLIDEDFDYCTLNVEAAVIGTGKLSKEEVQAYFEMMQAERRLNRPIRAGGDILNSLLTHRHLE